MRPLKTGKGCLRHILPLNIRNLQKKAKKKKGSGNNLTKREKGFLNFSTLEIYKKKVRKKKEFNIIKEKEKSIFVL